tara:strand:- start:107 stop:337 length:231 start_codon:yes stop_codon:yes gene_type:complete
MCYNILTKWKKEGNQMSYSYKVLEDVLKNIAKDGSTENIYDQVDRLTTDEIRKLRDLITIVDQAGVDKIYDQGEYV